MRKNRRLGEKRAKKNIKLIAKKNKLLKKANKGLQPSLEKSQLSGIESKLSQTILEFGKPLIEEAENIEQEKHAIEVSIFIWNLSLLSSSKKDGVKRIKKHTEALKGNSNLILRLFLESFERLFDRKQKYFDYDKRVALDYSLEKTDTGFYLQVIPGSKKRNE